MKLGLTSFSAAAVFSTCCASADPAEITAAIAKKTPQGWRFDVTVRHPDTGWDHYADGWLIRGEDGTVYGERPLAHPHVAEQPFTRSVSGVVIPEGVQTIVVQANCSIDGENGQPFRLDLSQ